AVLVVVIGGGLSLVASGNPDGLEWSIENVTGSAELEPQSQHANATQNAAEIQEKTALLPDYAFKNNDTILGTSFSGIVGAGIVAVVSLGCLALIRLFKKKDYVKNN
ncbi:MAG: PDGLE domain-containing protein, partial [Mobilitalea sp.]